MSTDIQSTNDQYLRHDKILGGKMDFYLWKVETEFEVT
jgi:hypothetical protein